MSCSYLRFGLIVTGKTEERHLPKLFQSLTATGTCHFEVIRRIGQRDPITSPGRKLEMVGSGKIIPDKDATEIGFPARRYLIDDCHLVVLIDDLEYHRQGQVQQVFDRYRNTFDTILTDEQVSRASVHFLVTMLEAYYLADSDAVNAVLELAIPLPDCVEDVETIRNPKTDLKHLYPDFNEIDDGGKILDRIDIAHVLAHPKTCAWLRTLFAWCVKALHCYLLDEYADRLRKLDDQYKLHNGELCSVTRTQLDNICKTIMSAI